LRRRYVETRNVNLKGVGQSIAGQLAVGAGRCGATANLATKTAVAALTRGLA
jgi:hypothetical protein